MPSPAKIWEQKLLTLHARLAPLFHSTGPRQRSLAYLRGLLSVAELRKLMEKAGKTIEQILHWSDWRRRHQYRAQQCHYRRRGDHRLTEQLRL
ncbi:hypothetical protein KKJ17_15675 [Xenorhabdus bovienii]|nr:hypothetical protein [Xenorhabdus bovienii]MDE9519126.1 hypothetical protein [Xenorhabdus bovienii]